jgi:hypothetical protein
MWVFLLLLNFEIILLQTNFFFVAGSCLEFGKLLRALLRRRNPERLLLVVVEVAGVAGTLALGNEVSLNLNKKGNKELKLE